MDVDVWPVQLPLMPRKYLATTFHIQGVSEVCIPVQIPLSVESRGKSGGLPSATDPHFQGRGYYVRKARNFASLIVTILAVIVIVILNSSLLLLFSERGSHFEV